MITKLFHADQLLAPGAKMRIAYVTSKCYKLDCYERNYRKVDQTGLSQDKHFQNNFILHNIAQIYKQLVA